MDVDKIIPEVKAQYDELPYPPRNPEDERKRLLPTLGDNLDQINHCCFGGKPRSENDFRCLVAGGGTGDSLIFLAEQLKHSSTEVVYLDMSEGARNIAEKRAAIRGLKNIRWITASLLELPTLDLGLFDYINCSGVLHHLVSPEVGLQALTSVLKDDGAIFLMLYGRYGRQAVYEMQALLRELLPSDISINEKLKMARSVLLSLPKTNRFEQEKALWSREIRAEGNGDVGLYDLLLHSQDRSYTVAEIYQLAESAKLSVVDFVGDLQPMYNLNYALQGQELDSALRDHLKTLSKPQQQGIAEKFTGDMIKHQFYLSRYQNTVARLEDQSNVLVLARDLEEQYLAINDALSTNDGASVNFKIGQTQQTLNIPATRFNQYLICKYQ